jgi:mannose/fructose/N-acetylgalactosamine-specific phosphotransferase system component IID
VVAGYYKLQAAVLVNLVGFLLMMERKEQRKKKFRRCNIDWVGIGLPLLAAGISSLILLSLSLCLLSISMRRI